MHVWLDRVITAGIFFLLLFTPLAFGSVHPWAFSFVEVLLFFAVIIWMTKLTFASPWESGETYIYRRLRYLSSLLLPIALFIMFVAFQVVPLPPPFLRILSPSTYEVYQKSLPGWPEKPPYEDLIHRQKAATESLGASTWTLLPTADEIRRGARVPFSDNGRNVGSGLPYGSLSTASWLPISIAPSLTKTDLLKFIGYACLFFLTLFYPARTIDQRRLSPNETLRREENFTRSILLMLLFSGLLVAALGIVQTFSWNGKILWFFEPYDGGMAAPGQIPRASGPFINPANFGNYLALIFFLAITGAIFPTFIPFRGTEQAFRLFCAAIALVLLSAMLLSLSRGVWISTAVGLAFFSFAFIRLPEERRSALLLGKRKLGVYFFVLGLSLLLLLSLFLIGPEGSRQVGARLEETITQDVGLLGRARIWTASLRMFLDFPLWGVGLGAWPELFPRYKNPPWTPYFYREAHNDYVELLAETGIVGFGLLAFFFWQCGKVLLSGAERFPAKVFSVYTALLSALVTMAVHELFDFSLQIPANAFLFILILALALRLKSSPLFKEFNDLAVSSPAVLPSGRSRILLPALVGCAAFLLIFPAVTQDMIPYPYNVKEPVSVAEAREGILAHPGNSGGHLRLIQRLGDGVPPAWIAREIEIALWLNPTDPYARDLNAAFLLLHGRRQEGLEEISRSISYAPYFQVHAYLNSRIFYWLSLEEQEAVEKGFKQALAHGYPDAWQIVALYERLGRHADAGKLYEDVAIKTKDSEAKAQFLLKAGLFYAQAKEVHRAETLLRYAASISPRDSTPYRYLVTQVYASKKGLPVARTIVAEGIQNGADAFSLYVSLAEAAKKAGKPEEEKAALLEALQLKRSSLDVNFRLGVLWLQESNFDRSALHFRKAVDLNPRSADAYFHLALAEEGRHRFVDAGKAYGRAVELAPKQANYRDRYDAFKRKVADNRNANPAGSKEPTQ